MVTNECGSAPPRDVDERAPSYCGLLIDAGRQGRKHVERLKVSDGRIARVIEAELARVSATMELRATTEVLPIVMLYQVTGAPPPAFVFEAEPTPQDDDRIAFKIAPALVVELGHTDADTIAGFGKGNGPIVEDVEYVMGQLSKTGLARPHRDLVPVVLLYRRPLKEAEPLARVLKAPRRTYSVRDYGRTFSRSGAPDV